MLSWKRMLYVVLIVSAVSCVFMIYSINEERARHIQITNIPKARREFVEAMQTDVVVRPHVWLVGQGEEELYQEIHRNIRQYFENLHFSVQAEMRLEPEGLLI